MGGDVGAQLLFYGSSSNGAKTKLLDPHPTEMLLASMDEDHRVSIWDYRLGALVKSALPSQIHSPSPGAVRHIRWTPWRRWKDFELIVCCDAAALVVGASTLACSSAITCEMLQIEGKTASISCCEVLSATQIAFGCSDGCIRVWEYDGAGSGGKLIARHAGHKEKSPISHILKLTPDDCDGSTARVVSVGEAGQVFLWKEGIGQNTAPSSTALAHKKHEKDWASLSYCAHSGLLSGMVHPSRRRPGQGEMKLILWSLREGGISWRHRIVKRCIGHAILSDAGLSRATGGSVIALCAKDSIITLVVTTESSVSGSSGPSAAAGGAGEDGEGEEADLSLRQVDNVASIDLSLLAGRRVEEKIKVYSLSAHPQRRNILFCASNVGVFVLTVSCPSEPLVRTPHLYSTNTSWLSRGEVFTTTASRGGLSLCRISNAPLKEELVAPHPSNLTSPTPSSIFSEEIDCHPHRGLILLKRRRESYKLMELCEGGKPKVLDEGACLDVAWCTSGPKITDIQAAYVVLLRQGSVVTLRVVDGGAAREILRVSLEEPWVTVHGGPLVCICSEGESRFLQWQGAESGEGSLCTVRSGDGPAVDVAWDERGHRCAVLRHGGLVDVLQHSEGEKLTAIAEMEMGRGTLDSAQWILGTLFCSSASGIWACVFHALPGGVSRYQIASAAQASPHRTHPEGLAPPLFQLPPTPLQLIGLHEGRLVVASNGKHLAFPMFWPGIRFIMLAAAGAVDRALRLNPLLTQAGRREAAVLLSELGHPEASAQVYYGDSDSSPKTSAIRALLERGVGASVVMAELAD
jgi:WD40 repeat protein